MLSNKPKNLKVKDDKADAWFYEERSGLEVIVEIQKLTADGRSFKDHLHITIPWRAVAASMRRHSPSTNSSPTVQEK